MRHIIGAAAAVHEWRGITIRELTPPGNDIPGSLVEVDVPADITHPVARSTRCATFYYCARGELDFSADGRQIHITPGDLVMVEQGEWYSYCNDSGQPVRLLSINVPAYDASATEVQEFTREDGDRG
jgi:mannose-6-phosphate isomerase-like protein (cupin superfamily)